MWAIKIAPFNRYQTLDVVRAVADAGRDDIALYTGNDDNIVADLLTPFPVARRRTTSLRWIVGGLLGQWAVWTHARRRAARSRASRARCEHDRRRAACARAPHSPTRTPRSSTPRTDSPAAFPASTKCCAARDCSPAPGASIPHETLSPGQAEEIDRVCRAHPELTDDEFVRGRTGEVAALSVSDC